MASIDLSDHRGQFDKIVDPHEGTIRGGSGKLFGLIDIGPGRQQRAQPSLAVEEHDAVFAPVLLARGHNEALAAPRMERMRDFDLYARLSTRMGCTRGSTRKGSSSPA